MNGMREWWDGLTNRQRAVLRWSLPLIAVALLVLLDWWRYHLAGVATVQEGRKLLERTGYILVLAVVLKLVLTRQWPPADLGWVYTIAGVAGLLIRVLGGGGYARTSETERDMIQAVLDVGSFVLLVGLILLGIRRFVPRRQPTATEYPTDG